MAKFIGAVRFPDDYLAWFIWNGTVDLAKPRLFATPQAAGDAWDDPQSGAYDPREGGEPVDVMPHYGYAGEGNQSVFFRSRADRAQMLLIGPLGLDTACDEERGHIVGLPEVVNDPSTTN